MSRNRIPGEFVPLDVRYRRDRAIRRAGAEAELLFLRALALAKREETAGVIEDYDLAELTEGLRDPDAAIKALADGHLWVRRVEGSWLIRSWEKWNPATNPSASGSLGNHNRWHRDRGEVSADCPYCIAPESPRYRPDGKAIIAPDIAPESGSDIAPESQSESQSREDKSREEKKSISSAKSAAPIRADVEDMLDYFDARLEQCGVVDRPSRNKRNRDAARLMLDRDRHDPHEIRAVIDWATASTFWAPNIGSVSKLRDKYQTLRGQMRRADDAPRPQSKQDRNLAILDRAADRERAMLQGELP